LTLKAVASLARQSFSGFFEVVLVNNQSKPDTMRQIKSGVSKLADKLTVRIIDYDRPFNHSDQCNIGVRSSIGEVVIFLNNDCEILSPTAVSELAAWALAPNVGSAGAAIIDPALGQPHAGMTARIGPAHYFDSIVEERSGASISPFVRRTFG